MSETVFSCITLRALMRLYQIQLRPLPDGRWIGRHPCSVRPGSALLLDANGGSWTTNDTPPMGGDRLDFIACVECVTRERAAELLHGTYPTILEREGIPESGFVKELRRDESGFVKELHRDESGFVKELRRDEEGF
jgi:hypothetical protein